MVYLSQVVEDTEAALGHCNGHGVFGAYGDSCARVWQHMKSSQELDFYLEQGYSSSIHRNANKTKNKSPTEQTATYLLTGREI